MAECRRSKCFNPLKSGQLIFTLIVMNVSSSSRIMFQSPKIGSTHFHPMSTHAGYSKSILMPLFPKLQSLYDLLIIYNDFEKIMFGDCLDFFAKKVSSFHIYINQFSLCLLAIASMVFRGKMGEFRKLILSRTFFKKHPALYQPQYRKLTFLFK